MLRANPHLGYKRYQSIEECISVGDFQACTHMLENQLIPSSDRGSICRWAAQYGNISILSYAYTHDYYWSVETCRVAAKFGHIQCLQFAHEHGCPWDLTVCACAARYGQLDCLMYARAHDCDWDHTTCTSAIKGGHVECLEYAYSNGCRLQYLTDTSSYHFAHAQYWTGCLQYLEEHDFYFVKYCEFEHETDIYDHDYVSDEDYSSDDEGYRTNYYNRMDI
jgi:hypothetical protein